MGPVPYAVNTLEITATDAIADADAKLFINGVLAGSGVSKPIPLDPGPNTITVKVILDKTDNGNASNIEERIYTLTVDRTPELYVSGTGAAGPAGNDVSGDGSRNKPYATIQKALTMVQNSLFSTFAIIISGTVNGGVNISGSGYPHIILKGAPGGGTIDASGGTNALSIGSGSTVSLGDNLILRNASGGGVYVAGTFIMDGGSIQNNTASTGGGVTVAAGGTFTMTGGYIQNNLSTSSGGGVYVYGGTFTMSGGVIQNNTASFLGGGGVLVSSLITGTTFVKTGGTIDGNNNASPGRAVNALGGNACELTVGPAVNLYAKYDSGTGWSYVDPGIGDTSGNWH
jgi:hypothetical protein